MSDPQFTKGDVITVNAALLALENPVPQLLDGKESRQPYNLGSKAKVAIIRNLKKLKGPVEEITAEREALRHVYNPLGLKTSELGEDTAREWDQAHGKLMKEPSPPIKFHSVPLDDFNLEKNVTLPPSIIAALLGTVIEDTAPQDGAPD